MKHTTALLLLLTTLTAGCTHETDVPDRGGERLCLTGSRYGDFYLYGTRSGGRNSLPDGSTASFFASGGIEAQGETLILQGGYWESDATYLWGEQDEAQIHAYCPALPHEEQPLYEADGRLKDLLHCHQTIVRGEVAVLQFEHLFAQVSFEVSPQLNQRITSIQFTPSAVVEKVSLPDGEIITTSEEKARNVSEKGGIVFTKRTDGIYRIIVSPAENQRIGIELCTDEGTTVTETVACRFEKGHSYTCRLISTNEPAGIRSAEDFIAFSHLINGETYPGRTLDEFGAEENGLPTYRLHTNIRFTPEENLRIKPIGLSDKNPFNGCFDGQGYSLKGLELSPVSGENNLGLFINIGKQGIVRNLEIKDATYTVPADASCTYATFLASYNEGTIDGCRVTDCQLIAEKEISTSGMTDYNKGTMLNCSVEGVTFTGTINYAGGLIRVINGKVLNSYVADCDMKTAQKGGGLAHNIDGGTVINCYIYSITHGTKNKQYAALIHTKNTGTVQYCYYPDTESKAFSNVDATSTCYTYSSSTMTVDKLTDTPLLVDRLNWWIDEKGSTSYPSRQFHTWTTGELPPVVLQRP